MMNILNGGALMLIIKIDFQEFMVMRLGLQVLVKD